jgi:predicted transposase YdaD
MAVLSESPWYQEIIRQGQKQERLSSIEIALEIKFGTQGLPLMPLISQIADFEQLKVIQRGVLTLNNLDELRELIHNIQNPARN